MKNILFIVYTRLYFDISNTIMAYANRFLSSVDFSSQTVHGKLLFRSKPIISKDGN